MAVPDVSVILPYRNAADTIKEALDSILCQTGVTFEVVLVDDGSTDEGPAYVEAKADPRVVTVQTEGVGIAAALNVAIERAQAPLLARMDADDVALPGRFAAQVAYLREHPSVGALGTRVELFPVERVQEGLARYVDWQNTLLTPEAHRRQLFVESPLCHPSVMLRRDAVSAVGGYRQGNFPEDYDMWLRLDAAGYGLAKLDGLFLRWRHHERQATVTDPRYDRARFTETKAPHLACRILESGRPLTVWGAGKTGKHLVRAMEPHGVQVAQFVDVDPAKIGRPARNVVVIALDDLPPPGEHTVVVAVGARGIRDKVREYLNTRGYIEGVDYWCAS